MRVEIKQSGGFAVFPGLNRPKIVDTRNLSRHKSRQLKDLVAQADFFKLPDQVGGVRPGGADYISYTITVEDGNRHKTVTAVDLEDDHTLSSLLQFVEAEYQPT